jgi:pimeloyl-ACP methyl ester carboxylesterase
VASAYDKMLFQQCVLQYEGLPIPTMVILAILVPLAAFGMVEAILHLKQYFGRILRKLISIINPVVPSSLDIANILSQPIPLEKLQYHIQEEKPVVEGAEKFIHWADPQRKQKTPISVVFLHGWSACRQEGRPVVGRIAKHLQANVYCGRLPGHGRQAKPQSGVTNRSGPGPDGCALLHEAKPQELFLSALDSLRIGLSLGDAVVLVGISTGGALATWLASLLLSSHASASKKEKEALEPLRDRIAALILISPAYALSHPFYPVLKHSFAAMRVLPGFLSQVVRARMIQAIIGPRRNIPANNGDHSRFSALSYPSAALLHLLDVLYEMEVVNYASITIPTLMIGNPEDPVVNFRVKATNAFLKFGDAPNKVLYCLTRGEHKHIMSCDYQSPSTVDEITQVILLFLSTNVVAAHHHDSDTAVGDNVPGSGRRNMQELEKERLTEQEIQDMSGRPGTHIGLGNFSSYPSIEDVARPLEF